MLGQGMHRGSEFDFERHPSGDNFELRGIELFSSGATSVGCRNKGNKYERFERGKNRVTPVSS